MKFKINYKILTPTLIFIILVLFFLILLKYPKAETKIYKNEEFSFHYPKEWQEISLGNLKKIDPELKVGFADSKGEGKFLLRIKEGVPKIQSFEEIEKELDKTMAKNLNSFKKISSEKIKIGGRESLNYNYTYKSKEEEIRQKMILVFGEEKIYYLIFHAPEENFEAYKEDFNLIISSLRI